MHGDPGCLERFGDAGYELLGHCRMYQKRLGGVADRATVCLGVEDDALGHVEVGCGVDVDVAVADTCLDHRHGRLGDHCLDQAGPSPRDEHIDKSARLHQRLGRVTVLPGTSGRSPREGPARPRQRVARR